VRSSKALRQQEAAHRLVDSAYALSAGEFDRALAGYDRVIELAPESRDARFGRAMTLLQLDAGPGSVETALADLEIIDRTGPEMAGVHALRGRLLAREGRPVESERELALAASIEPRLAIDHQILGDLDRGRGKCEDAIPHYDAAVRAEPQMAWALLQRGYCLRALGRLERARVDYEVLSRVWSEHALSHNNLANVLGDLRLFDDAFASYGRALEIDPDNATIRFNYGSTLYAAGRLDDAEGELRRVLAVDPDSSRTRNQLGRLLDRAGRLAEAAAEFRQVIDREEARPEGPDPARLGLAYLNLCDVQLRRRDLAGAERPCARSVEVSPGQADPHYNMATLRMLLGDREGALEHLERDVALGDHDHEYLLEDPVFPPLHDDPRFREIVESMRAGSHR
jgi:tetratricopeptide (TPR) repeat protein